ncbi:MAG: glycosyltransferase family 2 protein [Clostridia bacterium]|nr:glycosyltransferase family 2 protein [Clostridia bacterium]
MEKVLSFVIPSYNNARFLDKVLSSFLDFDVLDKLDVIVVNDGSTDNTVEEAEKFCSKYPDSFRLISQENKGHGGALNTGLAAAKGKFVKVIDADDWVVTENLKAFVTKLENTEADVVLTHHYTIDISTDETKKWMSYPHEFERAYSFEEIMSEWKSFDRSLTFHGITYNTNFYKKNCMQLSEHVFYEDHEYATVPCCVAERIVPIDMFIYCYRIGDVTQSVSDTNQLKRIGHTETVLRRLITEYSNRNFASDAQRSYYCMKAQGLLLSYITTVLLVEKNRKKGRSMAEKMMNEFRTLLPETYAKAVKQYKIFRLMNSLHINKSGWEKISGSKIYNKLRHNHSFE